MVAQLSPVTPEVVRWALDEDGRQLIDIAERVGVAVDDLDGWAAGDARPTRGQVTKLSEILRRPRSLFFLPRPPAPATLPASFRHPPGDDGRAVSPDARRYLRRARRLQHAVSWAMREREPLAVPRVGQSSDAETAAAVAREWLGVSDEQQRAWPNDMAATRAWRDALDAQGVLVLALQMGPDEVRGFSSWDEHAPLIAMNVSRVSPAARSFTLMHELGHLVTRTDATCVEGGERGLAARPLERWCERFAAAVLIPGAALAEVAARWQPGAADVGEVRIVKSRFKVSHRAAALRLIDAGLAPPSLYATVAATFQPSPPPEPREDAEFRQPARATTRLREYGPRALRVVLDALPATDALSVLSLRVGDVRRLAEEVPDLRVP